MARTEKKVLTLAAAVAFTFGLTGNAFAMHIMEGFLPAKYCIAWGIACVPFLAAGFSHQKDGWRPTGRPC